MQIWPSLSPLAPLRLNKFVSLFIQHWNEAAKSTTRYHQQTNNTSNRMQHQQYRQYCKQYMPIWVLCSLEGRKIKWVGRRDAGNGNVSRQGGLRRFTTSEVAFSPNKLPVMNGSTEQLFLPSPPQKPLSRLSLRPRRRLYSGAGPELVAVASTTNGS
jgi:hypothetical protein